MAVCPTGGHAHHRRARHTSLEAAPPGREHLHYRRLDPLGKLIPAEPSCIQGLRAGDRNRAGRRQDEVADVEVLLDDAGIARCGVAIDVEDARHQHQLFNARLL